MAAVVLDRLVRRFGDAIRSTSSDKGDDTAVVARERLLEIAEFLKADPELRFDLPIDCTCVDWYQRREPRFDVVYHLYSLERRHRVRLKVPIAESDPTCPSLAPLWPGLDWHEREAWDMYGVRFIGHPNLKRVLMYEEFVGHPLRKDYPIDGRQPLIPMRVVRQIPTQRQPPRDLLNEP